MLATCLRTAALALAALALGDAALAQTTIRFGRQTAGEDNVWLMIARPDLTANAGKAYKIEWNQFRASDVALNAYQGGQVDLFTTACNSVIAAASKDVDVKVIASVSRETQAGAPTQYLAKKAGGPEAIQDLKGKIIGIVGHRTATELWARMALRTGGLDPDKDVQWAIVPFATVGDAVRADKIATGAVPGLLAPTQLAKGDLKVLFTSKTGMPFDEELICVTASPSFAAKNAAAVRAFLADLKATTGYLMANRDTARKSLLDAKLVQLPPDIYLSSPEYERDPELRIDLANFARQQDALVSAGFVDKKIDLAKLVDLSFLAAK
jgi:ABC-type nitrate/sulfonate/bicarbonate transport system substrate-binding protein